VDDFAIERVREYDAPIAIVLGTGLNSLVQDPPRDRIIPYSEIGGLPRSTVKGHLSRFILDQIAGARVVFAQGRVHLYEGHSAREVAAGVRFLARGGIEKLILTNAAGSLNPDFSPGSWMMITDHLNLTGATPLLGGKPFVDLTNAYSPAWRERFMQAARTKSLTLHEGIYAGMIGPQYETPAEVKMLRALGADAVGMSTVHETIQARALGLEVVGFSCLTNWAAGLNSERLSHDEVLNIGAAASKIFATLLSTVLAQS
jgi:purine-nucleoside phosphorylase